MPRVKKADKIQTRSLDAKGFYSDFFEDGTLYAVLVRSPAAAGKIKNITAPDLDKDYSLYTANNIPGKKTISANNNVIKIFGYNQISYTGEPVGILVGPDEKKLYSELENVSVNFDIESLESALKNVIKNQKRPVVNLHEETDENSQEFSDFVNKINEMPSLDTVLDKTHIQDNPNITIATREIKSGLYKNLSYEEAEKELFDSTKHIVTEFWSQKILTPQWQETDGAFCYTEGEKLHVYAPTKWTSFLQNSLASVLDIPKESIYIHKTKSYGVFTDGLWRTAQIAIQCAVASYLEKKPVKLVLSQEEQDFYMAAGVQTEIKYKTSVSENGKINAMHVDIDIDVGALNPFAQEITDRIAIASCNYYKPDNLFLSVNTHTSQNPPTSICIKNVDSQSFFAIENQIQKISNETNILPDEIRLINSTASKNSDFPFDIVSADVSEVINEVLTKSDFNRKYASFHMEAIDRTAKDAKPFFALPLRGIGISTAYNESGYFGDSSFSYDSKIEATLNKDGKLVIHSLKPSEEVSDIWKTTASEILQIQKNDVIIDSEFELSEIPSSPEDTFSLIGISNELIKKCCNDIKKRQFHQPLPLSAKKSLSPAFKRSWKKDSFSGNPFYSTAFAATIVEVELDTYTYNEKIKGIWVSVDCGELYDKAAAIRTIRLEIQQELLMLVEDRNIPVDNIHIFFTESKNRPGQIGGLIHNTLPAAFASALSLALATQLTKLPCTEKQLYTLIKERGKKVYNTSLDSQKTADTVTEEVEK